MSKVLIIGGGELGQALAHLVNSQNGLFIFDADRRKSNTDLSLEKLAGSCDFIFLAIPTASLETVGKIIKPFVKATALIISLSKGMSATESFSAEILSRLFNEKNIVLLNGPMLAEEIADEKRAFAVVASADTAFPLLKNILNQDYLKLVWSPDVLGASILGVTKNIYTIGLSLALALDLGQNTYGFLVTEALTELEYINIQLGGQAQTVLSVAGLGDLLATSLSEHSRNRQVGVEIVTKGKCGLESEGLLALPLLLERLGKNIEQLPFLQAITEIVIKHQEPQYVFTKFFQHLQTN